MVTLIGMGSGSWETLSVQAQDAVRRAGLVFGAKRLLAGLPPECTARQFAETLRIAVQIEEESWGRNLVMDTTKLERFGIRFDTTQQGIQRCLKDYGLRTL